MCTEMQQQVMDERFGELEAAWPQIPRQVKETLLFLVWPYVPKTYAPFDNPPKETPGAAVDGEVV